MYAILDLISEEHQSRTTRREIKQKQLIWSPSRCWLRNQVDTRGLSTNLFYDVNDSASGALIGWFIRAGQPERRTPSRLVFV